LERNTLEKIRCRSSRGLGVFSSVNNPPYAVKMPTFETCREIKVLSPTRTYAPIGKKVFMENIASNDITGWCIVVVEHKRKILHLR